MASDRRERDPHPPRPQWVTRINEEGLVLGEGVVPLDPASLLATASANTGLTDFGDDDPADHWREHFGALIEAIEREADLNLLGLSAHAFGPPHLPAEPAAGHRLVQAPPGDRVGTHPKLVFIVGLPRSGTTILHEVLAEDPQFRIVKKWEALFPSPPPEEASYGTDSRIRKAHNLITIQDRISPEWKTMVCRGR